MQEDEEWSNFLRHNKIVHFSFAFLFILTQGVDKCHYTSGVHLDFWVTFVKQVCLKTCNWPLQCPWLSRSPNQHDISNSEPSSLLLAVRWGFSCLTSDSLAVQKWSKICSSTVLECLPSFRMSAVVGLANLSYFSSIFWHSVDPFFIKMNLIWMFLLHWSFYHFLKL